MKLPTIHFSGESPNSKKDTYKSFLANHLNRKPLHKNFLQAKVFYLISCHTLGIFDFHVANNYTIKFLALSPFNKLRGSFAKRETKRA